MTLIARAVGFGRALHDAGIGAGPGATTQFCRALTVVDVGDREEVRSAGLAVFVHGHEEIPIYDAVFDAFWRAPEPAEVEQPRPPKLGADPDAPMPGDAETADQADRATADEQQELNPTSEAYSAWELLRNRSFDRMTDDELRDAERLISLLAPRLERRLSRRYRLHAHGPRLAPRQMFRRNLASGGDPVQWLWRRRVDEPRQLVVLCDISGSMERHSRLLLRFVQALVATNRTTRTEAFVFGTHLSRVTRQLRTRDRDAALAQVAASVSDWGGGTRIGAALHEFNGRWARRVLRSSSVVIVVSDGWDLGDPELVRVETERLRRSCHRLIWLNPLASTPGYRPLTAGMAAAYPFIDHFVPAGSLGSLERLGQLLASVSA
ncbi:MAG TPA: VWA domain-containing protein [Candidatus Limnocylindrales bacterium]